MLPRITHFAHRLAVAGDVVHVFVDHAHEVGGEVCLTLTCEQLRGLLGG
jgi:hypothetical protein